MRKNDDRTIKANFLYLVFYRFRNTPILCASVDVAEVTKNRFIEDLTVEKIVIGIKELESEASVRDIIFIPCTPPRAGITGGEQSRLYSPLSRRLQSFSERSIRRFDFLPC